MLLLVTNGYNSLQKQYLQRISSLRMLSGLTDLVFDNRNARCSLTHSLTNSLTPWLNHSLTHARMDQSTHQLINSIAGNYQLIARWRRNQDKLRMPYSALCIRLACLIRSSYRIPRPCWNCWVFTIIRIMELSRCALVYSVTHILTHLHTFVIRISSCTYPATSFYQGVTQCHTVIAAINLVRLLGN